MTEEIFNRRIVKGTSPDQDKIIAIFEKTKGGKTRIVYGDKSDKVFLVSDESFKKMRSKPRTGKYILIKYDKYEFTSLKDQYEKTYEEAVMLKELTKGRINLFRTGSTGKTALQLFYDLCPVKQDESQPDKITDKECEILKMAKCGALIWGRKYKGKGYKYDVVSEYPSVMISKSLKIPWGGVEFSQMTKDDFEKLEFFRYGIYHVKVHNPDERLFRENFNNWYSHTDLNYAKMKLKCKLELINDGEDNAMIYNKLKSIRTIFEPFINYLFEFKNKGIKQVKKYLNALWGALCQKNTLDIPAVSEIHDDKMLFSIRPNFRDLKEDHNMNNHTITVYSKNNYYELDYARIGHFILASGRLKISNIILPNLDKCVRCHTDGIILTSPIEHVELGNNIGDLKLEEVGTCEIYDSCNYTFNDQRHGRKEIDNEDICMF
jgi:hypothetical protein